MAPITIQQFVIVVEMARTGMAFRANIIIVMIHPGKMGRIGITAAYVNVIKQGGKNDL